MLKEAAAAAAKEHFPVHNIQFDKGEKNVMSCQCLEGKMHSTENEVIMRESKPLCFYVINIPLINRVAQFLGPMLVFSREPCENHV